MSPIDKEQAHPVTQAQHREVLLALERNDDMNAKLAAQLARIEERLHHHYTEEHRDFNSLIRAVNGGKIAIKIIGIVIATIVAVAATVDWISEHAHWIPPKR